MKIANAVTIVNATVQPVNVAKNASVKRKNQNRFGEVFMHSHHHEHHHNHKVNAKTVIYLTWSFAINILLSVVELIAGIVGGSVALIGDALHNTSDALSILIAVLAYKIGLKKSNKHFTFGFKRAEIIGAFVNLILLFISALYLFVEGINRIISPQNINGELIIYISIIALIVDGITAKLSHHESHHNTNMKMLFLHNLADALGSVGVIISGLCVVYFDWHFVDGIIALMIAGYMVFHSIVAFPKITKILMNATPDNIDIDEIKKRLLKIKNVSDVHHIHVWNIDEEHISLDCHIVSEDITVLEKARNILAKNFNVHHSNIQLETKESNCRDCCL